jgi:Tat protein secretion system quality control protein TatD with DNase activity
MVFVHARNATVNTAMVLKEMAPQVSIIFSVKFVRAGHPVMVFVHARNATVNTAMVLKEMAQQVSIIFSVKFFRAGHQVMECHG